MDKIGTIEEFHSKKCYELYLYAVELAKQVNNFIDKGFLVVDIDNNVITKKFEFYNLKEPVVKQDGFVWVGFVYDDNDKVMLMDDFPKRHIRKIFSNIRICNPKNLEKLSFKNG